MCCLKLKLLTPKSDGAARFSHKLEVIFGTTKMGDKAKIMVAENRNAIPKTSSLKFFRHSLLEAQPDWGRLFLANDAVNAHGGEMKVRTREDEGSEFTIKITPCLN